MTIFLVGDVDQMMYAFTGAGPEILLDEVKKYYPDMLTFKLETNYRSTRRIIATCNQLISYNYSDKGGPYDQVFAKTLVPRPDAPEGTPVTWTEYEDTTEEAEAIAAEIAGALESGQRKPGAFFVAGRTRAQLGYLEGPLTRRRIPFINIAGGSFWTSRHIGILVNYLRLAIERGNQEAFKKVYNVSSEWMTVPWRNSEHYGEYSSHRFLGQAFLAACGNSLLKAERAARDKSSFAPGVEDICSFIEEITATLDQGTVAALEFIVEHCLVRWLKAEEGIVEVDQAENGKIEDLRTAIEVAGQFKDARDFLAHVDEMVKADEARKDKDWKDYVVVSTIHRLKGLERPVVYGIGFSESDGDQGLLPHTFSKSAPKQQGILPTGGQGRIEDERCIAFVLVSRGQEEVHLSGVERYRNTAMGPSRFVAEMGLIPDEQPEESPVTEVQ